MRGVIRASWHVFILAGMTCAADSLRAAWLLAGSTILVGTVAAASDAQPQDPGDLADFTASVLPTVWVVAGSPWPGADVDRRQLAGASVVMDASDVTRFGIPDLTGAITRSVAAATINDVEGNVFQPDILFRGFTASPVAGTPQGLAVYIDGARFNDGFGDTVNWDLIPPEAIDRVDVQAANPVFGLNALGGSVTVHLKDAFSAPGSAVTLYGGSFGRSSGIVEFTGARGDAGLYLAGDVTRDSGYRDTGQSLLRRAYADAGWRDDAAELHFSLNAAHDLLGNPGATPIQALAADPRAIFTAPNTVDNSYYALRARGSWRVDAQQSLQAFVYFQALNQVVPNGITVDIAPCGDGSGLLCNGDGSVATGLGGRPIADFLNGAAYSGLSTQQLGTHSYGAAVQWRTEAAHETWSEQRMLGVGVDGSYSGFAGAQSLGGFDPGSRQYLGPGVVLDEPAQGVNPVQVGAATRFYGAFARDLVGLGKQVDLDLAARFDAAEVVLQDERGGPVSGRHHYARLDPSVGLVWRAAPSLSLEASFAQTHRAPTPQELSCASAAAPCSLLNFFVGDPNLRQVVTTTVEVGVRGDVSLRGSGGVRWSVDAYRASTSNDILYESTVSNPNLAFYTNAGVTLRQGLEAQVEVHATGVKIAAGYAYTDATYRTALLLNSPDNPAADANGQIGVQPGDRIPGIARHRATLTASLDASVRTRVGATLTAQSGAFRFGDEANLTQPLGGYTLLDLHLEHDVTTGLSLFATVANALDRRYDSYGAFGPVDAVPWPRVPGGVQDPRTASPGPPRTLYGGIRWLF